MKQRINVTVLAMYPLVRACLESLLKNEIEINITGMAGSPAELVETISRNQPDIVMLCLMKDETSNIGMIPEMILINPGTRFVILIEPDKHYDQMEA